jgi:hypothetical protein
MMERQEVEAVLTTAEIHDAGLVGMQPQPDTGQHRLDLASGLFGPAWGGSEDHEVVRVPDQRPQTGRRLPRLIDALDKNRSVRDVVSVGTWGGSWVLLRWSVAAIGTLGSGRS